MLRRDITYKFVDDEGKEVTETKTFWFDLSEEEMMEWMSKVPGGKLAEELERIVQEGDTEKIFAFGKKVILDSYGVREDGGRGFDKSPEIRRKFEKSFAYKQLFKELTLDPNAENALADFLNGVIPKIGQDQDKPQVVNTVKTP